MRIKNMIKKATVAALTAVMILAPIVNVKAASSDVIDSSTCRRNDPDPWRIVCILQKEKEKDVKKNQDEEINKEIVKSVISQGIPVEKFFELGGEIIKLDTSPNSTHVNVFEMAGIDPKKVEENTKLINDLINSMKE